MGPRQTGGGGGDKPETPAPQKEEELNRCIRDGKPLLRHLKPKPFETQSTCSQHRHWRRPHVGTQSVCSQRDFSLTPAVGSSQMSWLKPTPSAHSRASDVHVAAPGSCTTCRTMPLPSTALTSNVECVGHAPWAHPGQEGCSHHRPERQPQVQAQRPWLQPHPVAASAALTNDESREPVRTGNLHMATVLMATDEAQNINNRVHNGGTPCPRGTCPCGWCQARSLPSEVLAFLERSWIAPERFCSRPPTTPSWHQRPVYCEGATDGLAIGPSGRLATLAWHVRNHSLQVRPRYT